MKEKIIKAIFNNKEYTLYFKKDTLNKTKLYDNHCHPNFELVIVLSGTISTIINEKKYEISDGETIVFAPFTFHNILTKQNTSYERITMLFDEEIIPLPIKERFLTSVKNNPIIYNADILEIMNKLQNFDFPAKENELSAYASTLISEFFYAFTFGKTTETGASINEKIQQIIAYIDKNLSKKITLDEIARSVFLSKSAICHLFAKKMNITIKQYILQKKFVYAVSLLKNGVSAQEAAWTIGYESYADFYRIFKKITGESPNTIKKN